MRINSTGFIVFLIFFINLSHSVNINDAVEKFFDGLFDVGTPKLSEEDMTMSEIVLYHGYPIEEYNITTNDGYILNLFRIPYGRKNNFNVIKREPVLLLPGIFASSAVYVFNERDNNLPYLLTDNGYDVWLGNFRGSFYGRRHIFLSPKDKMFWKFSFDELAAYDFPKITDFILNITGYDKLHCVGHSMGNTVPFATLSSKIEYNNKIQSLHALAPIARMDHVKSLAFMLATYFYGFLAFIQNSFGSFEVMPYEPLNRIAVKIGCLWGSHLFCSIPYDLIDGFDEEGFDWSRLPLIAHFYPAGSSFQTLLHYIQVAVYHRFQWFDYGSKENIKKYNQTIPPLYDVSKITVPVALYRGENDNLASLEDINYLLQNLQNVTLNYLIPNKKFTHDDFMWNKEIGTLVFQKLIETIKQLS